MPILQKGPSGLSAANPLLPGRSRGRPTIGPHQRTDIYGLGPVIAASAQQTNLGKANNCFLKLYLRKRFFLSGIPPNGQSGPPKT